MSWTFIDICAGVGGFHAAATELGGTCVGAWENDPKAAAVYEDNWGIKPHGDVTEEDWTGLPNVNVVFAGFPCQPFSKGGAQRGMSETRGTIFFEVCKAIKETQPDIVCLENVRNLTGPKHTHTWAVIIRSLRDLGYKVSSQPVILSPHWIDPAEGGTPQNRERVYILATRTSADDAELEIEPTIQLNRSAASWSWDLERDLPLQLDEEIPAEELENLRAGADELSWFGAWDELVKQLRAERIELPRFPIWVDSWFDMSDVELMPAWKRSIVLKNKAFFRAHAELLSSWVASSGVGTFPASRRKLEWQAQDAKSLAECLVQLRPSGLRVKKATWAGALVAIDQRPYVVAKGRKLSARECARLQGFPETFRFDAAPRAAYKQMGNAVHVGSVRYALSNHLSAAETRAALEAGNPMLAV